MNKYLQVYDGFNVNFLTLKVDIRVYLQITNYTTIVLTNWKYINIYAIVYAIHKKIYSFHIDIGMVIINNVPTVLYIID